MSIAFGFYLLYSDIRKIPLDTHITVSHFVSLINILCQNSLHEQHTTSHIERIVKCENKFPMNACFHAVVTSALMAKKLTSNGFHHLFVKDEFPGVSPKSRRLFECTKIEFSFADKLYDILLKLGTEHLTRFHLMLANDDLLCMQNKVWFHYRAFHYYIQKDYTRVLDLGTLQTPRDDLISRLSTPDLYSGISECMSLYQNNIILLDDDILKVVGLLLLYDARYLKELHNGNKDWISSDFLMIYLKIQCLLKLGRSKDTALTVFNEIRDNNTLMHFEKIIKMFLICKILRYVSPVPSQHRERYGSVPLQFRFTEIQE